MAIRNNIIHLFLFFQSLNLFGQINLGFGQEYLIKNDITLARVLMEVGNEKMISQLLEEDKRYLFIISVDSIGHVMDIENIHPQVDNNFTKELKKQVKTYLISNKIQFYICYQLDWEPTEKDYELTKESIRNKKSNLINIQFPSLYFSMRKKQYESEFPSLSTYEYLKLYVEDCLALEKLNNE